MVSWLALTEYSNKYRISVSTLRRRIKSGVLEHLYEEGKYLLRDEPLSKQKEKAANLSEEKEEKAPIQNQELQDKDILSEVTEGALFDSANKLIAEIKKAYMLILQEKEEQILQLKKEVVDYTTLVSALEEENERLKNHHHQHDIEPAQIDTWMK